MKRCIAIIPARIGSKRIRFKNIKKFFNKPIIEHVIKKAIKSKCFDEVFVSTDSKIIKKISEKAGASVPFIRPKKISNDYSTTRQVMKNMIRELDKKNINFEYVCLLYPTSIFINKKNLNMGLKLLKKYSNEFIITASEFNSPIQRSFKVKNEKIYKSMKKRFFFKRSNKLEKFYYDAGQFYFGKKKLFLTNSPSLRKNSRVVLFKKYDAIDINDPIDWKFAETIFKHKKLF